MTRHVTSTLWTVLIVAAVMYLPTLLGVRAAAGQAGAAQAAMSDGEKFVGTYQLITVEVRDAASGEWVQRPTCNSIGYIIYADSGHMGVHIMPRSRQPTASNPPTVEEAQAALRGYMAHFGSFTVDDAS